MGNQSGLLTKVSCNEPLLAGPDHRMRQQLVPLLIMPFRTANARSEARTIMSQFEFATGRHGGGGSVIDTKLKCPALHPLTAAVVARRSLRCVTNLVSSASTRSISSSQRFMTSRACLWTSANRSESTSDGLDTDPTFPRAVIETRDNEKCFLD